MLRKMYDWVMSLAGHKHAKLALAAVSFAESSFFPIPPDPLYLAMALKDRKNTWNLAILCTVTSVLGGYLGYAIGYGLYETIGKTIIQFYGAGESFHTVQDQFNKWGFWIVALKGLTPIPFKVVTIASGVAGLDLWTFTIASIVARGFRFFYVAILLWFFGPKIKTYIEENLTMVTIVGVTALIGGFFIIKYFF
jgi:membrane protein YqaA with SNARE-associated domain